MDEIQLVGINLLREGLNIPEVSLVAILYANDPSDAIKSASEETKHRRRIQVNEEHSLEPTTIKKEIAESSLPGTKTDASGVAGEGPSDADEAARQIEHLKERMQEAANNLEFELAADIRDRIHELRREFNLITDAADEGVPIPRNE